MEKRPPPGWTDKARIPLIQQSADVEAMLTATRVSLFMILFSALKARFRELLRGRFMNGTLRVIGGESDIRFSAALDYSTSSGDFYQGGFKRGAELWLQHFIRDIDAAALDRDRLVLPILFLFRHYLELRFKEIIMYGGRILGEDSNWPFGHDLADLWQRCRNVCERIYGSDHADHLQFLDNCFDDICHLDPTSENFRYPIDRHGDPLFQHVVIGLRNLNTALHDAGEFLEGITMDISVRLGHLDGQVVNKSVEIF